MDVFISVEAQKPVHGKMTIDELNAVLKDGGVKIHPRIVMNYDGEGKKRTHCFVDFIDVRPQRVGK